MDETPDAKRKKHAAYMREWYRLHPGYNAANVKRWRKKGKRPKERRSMSSEYRAILLDEVAKRDGGWLCRLCGVGVTLTTGYLDHLVSPLEGGRQELANLGMVCRVCNTKQALEVRKRTAGY